MSIDYLVCNHCGEGFPDVMDYEWCDCGLEWCDAECAEADGLEVNEEEDTRTCKFCRGEDFSDSDLLNKALELLSMTKEDLAIAMKNQQPQTEGEPGQQPRLHEK